MKIIKNRLIMVKDKEIEFETIKNVSSVYKFLIEKLELDKEPEEVAVMLALDNKLNIVSCCDISRGDLSTAMLNPREVYKRALLSNAKGIIIAHNHPSGECEPSVEDQLITNQLKEAGNMIGIDLYDHIIVGNEKYYSFFEENPKLIKEIPYKKEFYKKCNKEKAERRVDL